MKTRFNLLMRSIASVFFGSKDNIAMAIVAVCGGGHLLLEDVPGTGKTTLAKALARSIDGSFSRIQFTPDLLPSDVTGGLIFNQKKGEFETHRGPIFANVVLADEINRASPKTQAALLEVMEEGQVTIDGKALKVPQPFFVIATQNPIDQEGTYKLPEAQLDRFLMRTSLGYPSRDATIEVMRGNAEQVRPEDIEPVVSAEDVLEMIDYVRSIVIEEPVYEYIFDLVEATRELEDVQLGASPRGAIALSRSARAIAAAQGRDYVSPDDVKRVAGPVLSHRLILTPDAELDDETTAIQLIDDVLGSVDAPSVKRRD